MNEILITEVPAKQQLSSSKEDVFKVNYDFLMKTKTYEELKCMASDMGEVRLSKCKSKTNLCDRILNNVQYVPKTIAEADIEIKNKQTEDLRIRLYSQTREVPNEHQDRPCLEFTGALNSGGYGKTSVGYSSCIAHRVAYALHHNIDVDKIPRERNGNTLHVCHGKGCKRTCIEGTHLELKTVGENQFDDKVRDGCTIEGEKNGSNKITEELALEIKHSKGDGRTRIERAADYGVTVGIVQSIDHCDAWARLPDKNGEVSDTSKRRQRNSENYKKNKQKVLTEKECEEALEMLRNKSVDSEVIQKKVDTVCWLFKGAKETYMYVDFKGIRFTGAHILAYEATYGKRDPESKNVIRHLCNIRGCCRPSHLAYGTQSENTLDAMENGHKQLKLTDDDVRNIRKMDSSLMHIQIAALYGVSPTTICSIRNGTGRTRVI